jgi:predicted RNase H-like HicB family nuclease
MENYFARFEPDTKDGGYVVTFPDFGYGATQGETAEEALALAQDLLMLSIEDHIREGKALPIPSRHRGAHYKPVPLSILQSAKV